MDVLRADLAAARDECYRLKWQLHECQTPLEATECRELARAFDACRFPEQTPIGALIRLPEYDELTEEDRREIRHVLEEYPILLQPGEATWIAERWRLQDWHTYGRDVREAIILFLGPGRVAKELPADRLAQIREECDENEWLRLFGNR